VSALDRFRVRARVGLGFLQLRRHVFFVPSVAFVAPFLRSGTSVTSLACSHDCEAARISTSPRGVVAPSPPAAQPHRGPSQPAVNVVRRCPHRHEPFSNREPRTGLQTKFVAASLHRSRSKTSHRRVVAPSRSAAQPRCGPSQRSVNGVHRSHRRRKLSDPRTANQATNEVRCCESAPFQIQNVASPPRRLPRRSRAVARLRVL
jgi:hypothetical protein